MSCSSTFNLCSISWVHLGETFLLCLWLYYQTNGSILQNRIFAMFTNSCTNFSFCILETLTMLHRSLVLWNNPFWMLHYCFILKYCGLEHLLHNCNVLTDPGSSPGLGTFFTEFDCWYLRVASCRIWFAGYDHWYVPVVVFDHKTWHDLTNMVF